MDKGCLYAKIFENGKIYIGITVNFKKRMYDHDYHAFKKISHLPVHRAMRKYKHRTEIWAEGIDDRELLCQLEIQTIQQLINFGYKIYNITKGGDSVTGLFGDKNPSAKPMSYYENYPVTRGSFKRTCLHMDWTFEHFKEVFAFIDYNTANKSKKFYYFYVGENNNDYHKKKDVAYYETHSITRYHFKRYCHNHNLNFCDFEETLEGICTRKDGIRKERKYFYKYNPNVNHLRIFENTQHNNVSVDYYMQVSHSRNFFKKICKRQGYNFDDFIEIDSGEKYNSGNIKKYYYKFKGGKMLVEIVNIVRKKGTHQKDEWKGVYRIEELRKGYGMILEGTDSYKYLHTSQVKKIKFFDDRSLFVVETLNTKYEMKVVEW